MVKVVPVEDRIVAMDVSCRYGQHHCRNTALMQVNGSTISCSSLHSRHLKWDIGPLCDIDDQIAKFEIGDHACIVNKYCRPTAKLDWRFFGLNSRHIPGEAPIQNDSNIGIDYFDAGSRSS